MGKQRSQLQFSLTAAFSTRRGGEEEVQGRLAETVNTHFGKALRNKQKEEKKIAGLFSLTPVIWTIFSRQKLSNSELAECFS